MAPALHNSTHPNRLAAIMRGEKFFDGFPCAKNPAHGGRRYVIESACVTCRLENVRANNQFLAEHKRAERANEKATWAAKLARDHLENEMRKKPEAGEASDLACFAGIVEQRNSMRKLAELKRDERKPRVGQDGDEELDQKLGEISAQFLTLLHQEKLLAVRSGIA